MSHLIGEIEGALPLQNVYFPLSFEGEGFTLKGIKGVR